MSVAFYLILGLVAVWGMNNAKSDEIRTGFLASYKNIYLFSWWSIWVFFAVFRLVSPAIWGTDAPTYVNYFENCNSAYRTSWFDHVEGDLGFKWINKTIRFLNGNYHFYFLAVYGFMAYVYIAFLNTYTLKKSNWMPFILSFYLFLRSYNTIRSNLAIAIIALGCIFIIKRKWTWAYIIAFTSVFIHKSAIAFAMVVPFSHFFQEKKLSLKTIIFFILVSIMLRGTLQSFFIQYASVHELNGAYSYYANKSTGESFWANAWKIAFEQIALGAMMFLLKNKIGHGHDEKDSKRIHIIWCICVFDMMMIPMNFVLGIWRGYEFFYLARIIMWAECIYQLFKTATKDLKLIICVGVLIALAAWMCFRIYATYEDSPLLPSVFEFLV